MTSIAQESGATTRASAREWWGLCILALPCLLYSMDLTVLNLAVPHLTADLQPTGTQILWIVDVYGLVLAGALITMGALGDRIGRRKLLLWGAAAFGAASVLAAFAPTAEALIIARALLGLAAATLAPSTLSLISSMFRDDRQRGFAIGVWMASFSLGGAIGPLVGGALLEHYWWGSVFLVSVPVMALLLIAGPLLLPEFQDTEHHPIAISSAVLSIVAMLTFVYGLKKLVMGELEFIGVLALAVGIGAGIVFVRGQLRKARPMVDFRLFARKIFVIPVAIYFVGLFLAFGTLLLLSQYLQLVVGMQPFEAGLWTLFSAAGFLIGALGAPLISQRVSAPLLIPMSLTLASIGFALMAWSIQEGAFPVLLGGSYLMALGIGPVLSLSTDLIVGAVPLERASSAAAIAETSSELGGALGIGVMGSLALAIYRAQLAPDLDSALPGPIESEIAESFASAKTALASLDSAAAVELAIRAETAFNAGFAVQTASCAVIALLAAIVSLGLRRATR